jgi:hypothetical protein
LPVVLYGHEIWSLNVRKEYELQMSENKELRKNFDSRGMKQVRSYSII